MYLYILYELVRNIFPEVTLPPNILVAYMKPSFLVGSLYVQYDELFWGSLFIVPCNINNNNNKNKPPRIP